MLALCTLAAAALFGYWKLSELPPDSSRGAAPQLIPDRSLPDPRHRILDEITIEQAADAQTAGALAASAQDLGAQVASALTASAQAAEAARIQFTLQRRRDGQRAGFYLIPSGSPADEAEVESLFSALLSAVAERRLGSTAEPKQATPVRGADGSTPDAAMGSCRVRVRFGAGHWLCFGAESASGSVYVRSDFSPDTLVVDRGIFELLARPPARYRARSMVAVPLPAIQRLALGTLHLFRDGDLWRVQGPDAAWTVADPALVAELLQRLGAWKVSAWPAGPPPESPPPLRLTLDGVELLRGGWPGPPDCPPATRLFVRAAGEPVCAEDPASLRLLPEAAALRAQSLLPLTDAEVQRLQLAPNLDLVRKPDGTYTCSGHPAETASVRRVLSLLTTARATAVPAPAGPPADAVRLQITTTLGQKVALQLWRRGPDSFVQRDAEAPQRLTETIPELFSLDELTFAPLQLLVFDRLAARQLVRSGPAREVLEHTASWQLREPTAAPASSAAVATLLDTLADLRAERWVSKVARPEYGLDPARLRITVQLGSSDAAAKWNPAAGQELAVEIGAPAGDRGGCYARRPATAQVALLPAASCAALSQPLLSPLLLRVDDDRLTELQLEPGRPGAAALSCGQSTGRWRCDGQELPPAAQRLLLAALHALTRSESAAYAAAAPAVPPLLTLHLRHAPLTAAASPRPTEVAVVVEGEDVAPLEQTLRLYPAAEAGLLARLDRRGVTYRLPSAAAAAVRDGLAAANRTPQ